MRGAMVGVGDALVECESWRELGTRVMWENRDWERASAAAGFQGQPVTFIGPVDVHFGGVKKRTLVSCCEMEDEGNRRALSVGWVGQTERDWPVIWAGPWPECVARASHVA